MCERNIVKHTAAGAAAAAVVSFTSAAAAAAVGARGDAEKLQATAASPFIR